SSKGRSPTRRTNPRATGRPSGPTKRPASRSRPASGSTASPAALGGDRCRELRPAWLFAETVHEGCDRGGYYEPADFGLAYGAKPCIVKLGCWGPVVQCNVAKRGWMNGIGVCPHVGCVLTS